MESSLLAAIVEGLFILIAVWLGSVFATRITEASKRTSDTRMQAYNKFISAFVVYGMARKSSEKSEILLASKSLLEAKILVLTFGNKEIIRIVSEIYSGKYEKYDQLQPHILELINEIRKSELKLDNIALDKIDNILFK